jgi:succinate dehydrogenase/fumarate reductase cytochrome b subunit
MKNKPKEIFTKPIAQIKKFKICLLFVGKLINSDAINCISRLNQTYFKSFSLTLKVLQRSLITAIMLILLFLTGCIHMEMGMRKKMNMGKITSIKKVQEYNTNDKMDQVISKSVNNLKAQSLDISNIAV